MSANAFSLKDALTAANFIRVQIKTRIEDMYNRPVVDRVDHFTMISCDQSTPEVINLTFQRPISDEGEDLGTYVVHAKSDQILLVDLETGEAMVEDMWGKLYTMIFMQQLPIRREENDIPTEAQDAESILEQQRMFPPQEDKDGATTFLKALCVAEKAKWKQDEGMPDMVLSNLIDLEGPEPRLDLEFSCEADDCLQTHYVSVNPHQEIFLNAQNEAWVTSINGSKHQMVFVKRTAKTQ